MNMFSTSTHLYAQAAAGPEYEYPACLPSPLASFLRCQGGRTVL